MSENSKIEWTDHTFNPWIGCQKVGPGCDNCYAESMMDHRLKKVQWGPGAERARTSPSNWRLPLAWNTKHEQFFAEHGRRQRVFCASLADVFDNAVPREWRQDLFDLILATPNLDWLLLTKRIGNAAHMLQDIAEQRGTLMDAGDRYRPPTNVWIGATVVHQEEADRDIPQLLKVPAAKRFLSMEPLLGPVDLLKTGDVLCRCDGCLSMAREHPDSFGLQRVDWVIVGGESGLGARPMHPDWARSLRDQCAAAGVPFLFKQWGEWEPADPIQGGSMGDEMRRGTVQLLHAPGNPEGFFRRGDAFVRRVGKKAAGRLLDGVQHDGFPAALARKDGAQ